MVWVIRGHVLEELRRLPDECVDCVVTSPPYYGFRVYPGAEAVWGGAEGCPHSFTPDSSGGAVCNMCGAWRGQLGREPDPHTYIEHLLAVGDELKRVLKGTGTLFWNMGDTYAGRRQSGAAPPKSLMLIPERFAIGMVERGWILRNKVIWVKTNALPTSSPDRFSNKWEYVFFFVKSRKYYFDLDAVRKPYSDPARFLRAFSGRRYTQAEAQEAFLGRVPGILRRSQPNLRRLIGEVGNGLPLRGATQGVVTPRGSGGGTTTLVDGYLPLDRFLPEQAASAAGGVGDAFSFTGALLGRGANPGDVIQTAKSQHSLPHFACYPESLIAPLIIAGCPPGGVVLDPFAGSGTTGLVAEALGRSSIMVEVSEKYVDIIKRRISPDAVEDVKRLLRARGLL
jgi:DNA modification methylase